VPWDPEKYRLEVLEPARRAGNVPPANLYLRYGLPDDISDPRAFARRIAEVLAYWQALKSKRTYVRLAETLIAKHAELERAGRLTPAKFVELQAHAQREQTERLAGLAETEAGAATHVGPVTVARLRGALGGSVTEAEVTAALRKAAVKVVEEFPDLPARPHPKVADLTQNVDLLGLRLSPQVVFGDAIFAGFHVLDGFRLADGRLLGEAAIAGALRQVDALPHSDPAKTPKENILAILAGAARNPAELTALLLSEITERLRHLADSGFMQRAVAVQARALGLDEDEAGLVAAAMLTGNTVTVVRQQVEEELAAGRLRSAQRLLASLPASDQLRQLVAERDAQVSTLVRQAEQELAAGRPEQAARLLYEAGTIAADDADLAARLAALPPPPPPGASARVNGDQVLVSWEASPALAGRLHYRVMRGLGRAPASVAEGTAVVTQTEQHHTADAEAPPGVGLFYSVFATRGGSSWSKAAVTQSLIFAPEVTEVSVDTGETSVALSWRVHPGAVAVVAVRAEGRPPLGDEDGTVVDASLSGLGDAGLRTGTEYFYRVAASYRTPAGQRRSSAGIVVSATPAPAPEAVASLEIRAPDGSTGGAGSTGSAGSAAVVAAWAPPRHGQVRLVLSDKPPTWPPGTRLTLGDVDGLRRVPGIPRRGPDGLDVLELSPPPGRHYLIALTTGGRDVVVGDSAEIGLAEPVRDLSAFRMHDVVQLSWVWPEDATDVLIHWPGGEHRCSRRVYDDEGGVALSVGPAETQIEVRAVYSRPGGELTAPGVRVGVAGRRLALNYRIRRTGRLHPRQRVIEIAAERPTMLPALIVVRSTGRYAPDDAAEGEAVALIEPQPIAPGQPVSVTVELPKGTAWLACFIDPDRAEAPGVALFPPPDEEMRIR
jgi:hypothetical protein